MRFRPSDTQVPYLSRRDQWRMLGMLAALMLVVIGMRFANKPSSWYWLTGRPDQASHADETGNPADQQDLDFSVQAAGNDDFLPPGAFRSPLQPEPFAQADTQPEEPEPLAPQDGTEPAGINQSDDWEPAHDLNIPPEILQTIEDRTVGLRESEAMAHYYILAKTREIPPEVLREAARNDVAYAVFNIDSDLMRGQLVTIDGKARRILKYDAGNNEFGIRDLYEAWVFTPDSGNNPYRIVCTELPAGVPLGEDLTTPVHVRGTGYYFKQFGYATQQGLHVAPLILASRLEWLQPLVDETPDASLVPYIVGFVVLLGAALAGTLWRFTVSDRQFQQSHLKRLMEAPPEAIEALNGFPTHDVREVLGQLADQDKTADAPSRNKPTTNPGKDDRRTDDRRDSNPST